MNRRAFLVGLFGTAAVIAAGPIPEIIEALPETKFREAVLAAMPRADEVYGNGKDYAFATIQYLDREPWFKVTAPEGFKPLREESDRIGQEAIQRFLGEK